MPPPSPPPPAFHRMRSLKLRAPDHAAAHATAMPPPAIPPHALAEASRSGPCHRPCHRPVHRPPPPARFPRHPDREASASARRQGRVAIPPPIRTMPPPSPPPPPFHRMRSLKLRAPDHAAAHATAMPTPPIPPHALAEASRSGPCHRPVHRYAACRYAARRLHDSRATRTAKLQRARVAKAASPRPRRQGRVAKAASPRPRRQAAASPRPRVARGDSP
jgi:hypothetical protein